VSARLLLATSNPGKVSEYRALAGGLGVDLDVLPDFVSLPAFEENAATFAENAVGKALHYSRYGHDLVLAEDSGLVVPSLDGEPGPRSARYAGPGASDRDRVRKLLRDLEERAAGGRQARFVAVVALAQSGQPMAVFSDFVEGTIVQESRGNSGFGYDPIFLYEPLGKTFAELTAEEKNRYSHRARAFGKVAAFLRSRQNGLLL
jgi:XTP/dITP diphosphohydrolase